MIKTKAYPRAALIGNPSDGYNGKTIAFVFSNFECSVELSKSKVIRVASEESEITFEDLNEFNTKINDIGFLNFSGLYEEHKLILATIWKFNKYTIERNEQPIKSPFEIRYKSSIPKSVGLAGSSAIITATVRALMQFSNIIIPISDLPGFILSVETEELNIQAGLQDRVAQVYEQPISMDFSREITESNDQEAYKPIEGLKNINWYIAFPKKINEKSSVTHNKLKERYDSGDLQVLVAMQAFAGLTSAFSEALQSNNLPKLNMLINQNFDLRKKILPIIPEFQEIIDTARSIGVSAKYTGSGGAVIGIFENDDQFAKLELALHPLEVSIIRPHIIYKDED